MINKFYEEYYEKNSEVDNKIKDKELVRKFLLRFIQRSKNILDAGCGPGFEVGFLHKLGYNVEGCDVSKKGIEKANKINPGPKYFVCNLSEKPTKRKYDIIYSVDVIEHIPDYDLFLRNVYNSLKEDGFLILITPNANNIENRIKFFLGISNFLEQKPHLRFFSTNWLSHILNGNGFKIKESFGGTKRWPVLGISKSRLYKSLAGSIFLLAKK